MRISDERNSSGGGGELVLDYFEFVEGEPEASAGYGVAAGAPAI